MFVPRCKRQEISYKIYIAKKHRIDFLVTDILSSKGVKIAHNKYTHIIHTNPIPSCLSRYDFTMISFVYPPRAFLLL